jgi:hypothetical protein
VDATGSSYTYYPMAGTSAPFHSAANLWGAIAYSNTQVAVGNPGMQMYQYYQPVHVDAQGSVAGIPSSGPGTVMAVPVQLPGALDQLNATTVGQPTLANNILIAPANVVPGGGTVCGYPAVHPTMFVNSNPATSNDNLAYAGATGVANDSTSVNSGFSLAVGICGSGNTKQYAAPAGGVNFSEVSTSLGVVRGALASDGTSTQLCMENLDATPVSLYSAGGTAIQVESDGKLKTSVYGSNGSNSLSVQSSGALDKLGALGNIVTGAVQLSNAAGNPAVVTLVDSKGNTLGVTNGSLSVYATDTATMNPISVVNSGGTAPTLSLSVAPVSAAEPDDGFVSVPVSYVSRLPVAGKEQGTPAKK